MAYLDKYKDKDKRKQYMLLYQKEHVKDTRKYVGLYFSKTKDANVLARLDSVPNKTDYIRSLILQDIERNSWNPEMLQPCIAFWGAAKDKQALLRKLIRREMKEQERNPWHPEVRYSLHGWASLSHALS